jgi:two-component system, OmpR family, KDP operon response regulator KdpE
MGANGTEGPDPTGSVVLVIEDEPQLRRFLRAALRTQGYRVLEAETGAGGLAEAAAHVPDVIVLDLGLPDMDGVEVARRLREWSLTPVLVLSARGQERDKIEALDAGADDYLTKPFGVGELLARLRACLRRRAHASGDTGEMLFRCGDWEVDLEAHVVRRAGTELHLTPLQFRLLAALVRNAGKVVTHRQLLQEVWGPGATSQTHYLRVFMGQLRHKLEVDPAHPRHLVTEAGVGYRLREE